jgi:hypothetical protein
VKICELSIVRLDGGNVDLAVRIDVRCGRVLVARVEVTLENFALAVFGRHDVPGTLVTDVKPQKPENRR